MSMPLRLFSISKNGCLAAYFSMEFIGVCLIGRFWIKSTVERVLGIWDMHFYFHPFEVQKGSLCEDHSILCLHPIRVLVILWLIGRRYILGHMGNHYYLCVWLIHSIIRKKRQIKFKCYCNQVANKKQEGIVWKNTTCPVSWESLSSAFSDKCDGERVLEIWWA